jgi:PAS domain S-box-containing protein
MPSSELRRAAFIFAPLILVAAGIMYLLYRTEVSAAWSILQTEQRDLVEIGRRRIITKLEPVVSDLMYLAGQEALRQWLATKDPAARRKLAAEYLAFARHKVVYDIVRFLDLEGREVVRVDRNGEPRLIPDGELQDRNGRYFVPETLKLRQGQAYVSPFDLNFKNGAIELPVRPVIRFGAPVFDAEGRKQGMVLLNYRGERLLDRVRALAGYGRGDVWLLNEGGFWLLGPRPEDEWGFMYPERQTRTLAQAYPQAWEQIRQKASSGQFTVGGNLFTYAFVSSAESDMSLASHEKPAVDIVSAESWVLISHVPAHAIAAMTAAPRRNFMTAFSVAAVLLAAVVWIIVRQQTARLLAEAEIRDSEARFRTLVESAPDAVVIIDTGGRIVMVNARIEQLFGYTRDQLTGKPVEVLLPERFRKRHAGYRENYVIAPVSRPMGSGADLYGLRLDGSEFPVSISLSPVQTGGGMLIVAAIRDVTIEREAQKKIDDLNKRLMMENEALRNSQAQSRNLLELSPDAIIISNRNDEIVLCNRLAENLYGYSRGELIGKNVLVLNPARYRAGKENRAVYFEAVHDTEKNAQFIRTGIHRDGTEFPIEFRISSMNVRGEAFIFTAVRDVTQQHEAAKKLQELNERLSRDNNELDALNRELEAFSYSVSHDLRAPLRAIDGFSQALLEDYLDHLDDGGRDYLSRVRKAAQRMGQLIDDLLKLARITRVELNAGEVDLSAMVAEIIERLREEYPHRAAEITIAPGLCVHGDSRLLRIALENLLNNAWKFTAGKDPARIEFGQTEANGAPAYFVRDNGVGFNMAHADKLFGAFQRLHDAGAFPGTGIGLATVQRIIRKHGGNIWAEASPDQGAGFFFTL